MGCRYRSDFTGTESPVSEVNMLVRVSAFDADFAYACSRAAGYMNNAL